MSQIAPSLEKGAVSPPHSTLQILSYLGPGLIIAAAIVGSGELIGTTLVGARCGFWLLWLIVLGCVLKVFVQVEFGRVAIVHGLSALDALDRMPGPRLATHWMVWCWLAMFLFTVAQLGGIVGGVGEAMALSFPIRGDYQAYVQAELASGASTASRRAQENSPVAQGKPSGEEPAGRTLVSPRGYTWDESVWSAIITIVTAAVLADGRYGILQSVSVALVAIFTAATVASILGIQASPQWAISNQEWLRAFSFRLPPGDEKKAVLTAFSVFGIIGVGASELIAYPYWCLEKGYAKWTGRSDGTPAWAERANGWLSVMRWDAFCSLVVYTTATAAFYLLGAAILHRQGLVPKDALLMPTLERMYADNAFFLGWGKWIFLFGAFAVLYSTFLVATAGNARMAADAMGLFGVTGKDEATRKYYTKFWCITFPFISLAVYLLSKAPVTLVLLSGIAQAAMLPLLCVAAIYYRYFRCDRRVQPGVWWDIGLWASAVALVLAGVGAAALKLMEFASSLSGSK